MWSKILNNNNDTFFLFFFFLDYKRKSFKFVKRLSSFWKAASRFRSICKWRHGGHIGGQKQEHFYALGTKLYFHRNSLRKIVSSWPPTWTPCNVVANQE